MRIKNRWLALALVATLTFTNTCQGAGLNSVSENEILQSDTDIENAMDTYESNQDASEITPEVLSQEESENTSEIIPDGMPLEDSENTEGDIQEESGMLELLSNGAFVTLPEGEIYEYTQSYPAEDGISMEKGEALTFEEYVIEQINLGKTQIDVGAYRIPVEDFRDVMSGVLNSHPEIFFLTGGYSWSQNYTYVLSVTLETIAVSDEDKAAFYEEVDKPLELIDESMSPIEKALTIHDFIVADIEYSSERYETNTLQSEDYNMLGVVVRKKAVCQGYAEAYYYYMKKLGIPCELVSSSNHAWNQIQLDGKWYQVDCTWDDPTWDVPGRVQHTYFLKSDSFWSADAGAGSGGHHWNNKKYDCTDTQYDGTSTLLYNCKTATYKNPTDKNWYYLTGNTYVKGDKTSFWATSTSGVQVIKTISEVWNVWGKSSYWVGCFSKVIPRTEYVIYSDKQNIYYMNYDGTTTKTLYTLNSTERTQGYIYGIRVKNNKIQYMYATIPNETGPNMKFGSVDFPVLSGATTFTADMLDVTLPTGVIYDGQAHKPTVRIKSAYVGGAGKVTVTIKDSAGNITANPENAGTYDVYASVSTGITYAALSQTKVGSFTINKAALDSEQLNISALDVVYDGTERLASVTTHNSLVGVGSIVVEYEDEAGENVLAPTNAGIYNVYVSVGEGSNYTGLDRYLAASYEITKADLSLNHLTKGTNQVVYDGTPKYLECSLNSSLVGAGALTLTYEDMDGNEIEQPTELGTYKVYVNVAPGSNYNGLEKQLYSYFYILETLPSPTPTVTLPPSQNITEDPSNNPWDDYEDVYEVEVGDEFESGKLVFEITAVGNKNTVRVVEPVTNKIKSVTIPDKVSYEGITFSVTEIAPKAFMGCKNLKKITVKATALKKVGKKALSGIYYRAVIKVPKKQLKAYTKLFKNKGQKSTVKIK